MRMRLPNRRRSEVIEVKHTETNGSKTPYVLTAGFYEDDRVGEVFIDAPKADSTLGIICHDSAVLISIALQHGATVKEMQASVARTKLKGGLPQSVIGTVLDVLARVEKE